MKCGDPSDKKSKYTWTQGIEACKGTFRGEFRGKFRYIWGACRQAECLLIFFVSLLSVANAFTSTTGAPVVPPCAKCNPNPNNGKLSCCSPGADWFGKCGDAGENFAHTWTEGLDVCRPQGRARSAARDAEAQAMIGMETTEAQLNATNERNSYQQPTADSALRSVNCEHCDKLSKISAITSVFLVFLRAQI